MSAVEIPKDVQAGILAIYGPGELARRIAEMDQRDAALRDAITREIEAVERSPRSMTRQQHDVEL